MLPCFRFSGLEEKFATRQMPGCCESIEAPPDVRKNITKPAGLFRVDGHLDVGFHIRVQVQDDFVLTRVADGAFTHYDL